MDRSPDLRLSPNGGRRLNLHAQVVRELGLRILAGTLRPGDVLPNENDLGRELGVSRSILREAISLSRPRASSPRARVWERTSESPALEPS